MIAPALGGVHSWALAIGDGALSGNLARRYRRYDLVIVDGEGVTPRQVRVLHAGGRRFVLAYLDVGTIERGRSWYGAARPYRLDFWPDWGEWYAAVGQPGFRRLIAGRVAPAMLRKGVDGLFLDNTDMVESHPRQARGMRLLARELAGLRGLLFTQNGERSIGPTLRYYDGWNREDVGGTYDFGRHRYVRVGRADEREAERALGRMRARGLLTLATSYVAPGDRAGARRAARAACRVGALPFVSDIELRRVPRTPSRS